MIFFYCKGYAVSNQLDFVRVFQLYKSNYEISEFFSHCFS